LPVYSKLVGRIPEGPVDVVGDVHGEIHALNDLLGHMGYGPDGRHPEGRRLIFVGDLIDRGPDSPGVVRRVRRMVEEAGALAVLGNHEINLLRGLDKGFDNAWFFKHLGPAEQSEMLTLLAGLPIALERPDLRVVHANWHDDWVEVARNANYPVELFEEHESLIQEFLTREGITDPLEISLLKQNHNPVKRITSGPEKQAPDGQTTPGERKHHLRDTWWDEYSGPLCVVGHYWRMQDPDKPSHSHLFDDSKPFALLGKGHVMCVDYSVGKRYLERQRKGPGFQGPFHLRLGALRLPERTLVFDNGTTAPLG
jgi:hypothetical protein